MRIRTAVAIAISVTALGAVTAVAQTSDVTTPTAKGPVDSVTWAVYRETNSVDPIVAFDYPENVAVTLLCDSLLRQQPDGSLAPGVALSVTVPKPTVYKIRLRSGVKFWDGSPLTSADVVFSLKRAANPKAGGFYAAVFSRVKAIAASGPLGVVITLSKPDYWLRGELASMPGVIVSKSFATKQGKEFGSVKGGTMCTGPFKLASWKTGQGIRVTANGSYWDKALRPQVKTLTLKGVPDDGALTAGLLTGEISGTYPLQLTTLDKLRKDPAVKIYEGPSYASDAFIVSNTKSGALADVKIRQAFSLAIDREGLIKANWKGTAEVPHALANPGTVNPR